MKKLLKDMARRVVIICNRRRAASCPSLAPAGRTLIIAPHPDDEVFGCAGLVTQAVEAGAEVCVAILTGGGGSHRECCGIAPADLVEQRRRLASDAARELGLDSSSIFFLDFEDGSISEADTANMSRLEAVAARFRPDRIMVPHHGEGWPDHLAARRIGLLLGRAGAEVWEYCVWMWYYVNPRLDWARAARIRMTPANFDKKLRAVDAYIRPCAPCGRPYSGTLPPIFLDANSRDTELFFRIK